ncbi:MAG: phosphoribosylformylglycinamidine synthase subunit PurL, partial [Fervidicoccaceae archaeon]
MRSARSSRLVETIKLVGASDERLREINEKLGLKLSLDELRAVSRYFAERGRDPTDVELHTLAQTWSEHCRHKTFRGVIVDESGRVVAEDMLKSYIARATEEIGAPWVLSFLKDNAGIIEFVDGYALAVKVETHNHPSAVDPFGGAATGVGGVIRDVLAVWAKPVALIDVLCFGPLDYPHERLPLGVKHPRYLFRGVVSGIGYYGNNVGIPTVAGAVYFDEGYVGNVVVYAGCVGVLPKNAYKWAAKAGEYLLLLGNRTGRDGIGGATFASDELSNEAEAHRSAVQIPDPIEEEKLKRAILRIRDEGLGTGITDLGGGGLAVAVAEVAGRAGTGAEVELGEVHLREPLAPWEIWVSESQERMLLTVPRENVERVLDIVEEEELEASVIGRLTSGRSLRVYYYGETVADLDVEFLLNPPRAVRVASWRPPSLEEPELPEPSDLSSELLRLLASPNVASREEIIRTYDHEVQGNTLLKPLDGELGGPNDAVVLKPLDDSWAGVVISVGLKPSYSKIDPYWMAASSIEEALRNNVAVGGRRIAILDNFVWGNPEKPDRMGALLRAVEACYHFAKTFGTPFISGKDSLYNESPLGPVLPTLLITAIGVIPDAKKTVSVSLKRAGDPIYVLGLTRRELGGSEYYRLRGIVGASVPKVYPDESRKTMRALTRAIDLGH